MTDFDKLIGAIDTMKEEAEELQRQLDPERVVRMTVLSECITAKLQALSFRMRAKRDGL